MLVKPELILSVAVDPLFSSPTTSSFVVGVVVPIPTLPTVPTDEFPMMYIATVPVSNDPLPFTLNEIPLVSPP